ncbi:MAG: hypothetical protein IJ060_06495 [Oscillospiraceae bacterium]|nr:hypothetical protein [Oscillospiraceae bacterium]
MSKKKIKKWITAAIVLILLCYGAFWLLLRPSGITSDTAMNSFTKHRESYENTATYLAAKNYTTSITDLITIDQHFGISSEQTTEYTNMVNGVEHLMKIGIKEISAEGNCVRFILNSGGGMLKREHAELLYCKDGSSEGFTPLGYENWYYQIVSE